MAATSAGLSTTKWRTAHTPTWLLIAVAIGTGLIVGFDVWLAVQW